MAEKSAKELDPEVIATYEQLKVKHAAARNAQKRVSLLVPPQEEQRLSSTVIKAKSVIVHEHTYNCFHREKNSSRS